MGLITIAVSVMYRDDWSMPADHQMLTQLLFVKNIPVDLNAHERADLQISCVHIERSTHVISAQRLRSVLQSNLSIFPSLRSY